MTGDYVITFSPDGNSLASKIPELVDKIKKDKDDLIIVSRYLAGAKSYDDDFITAFGNKMFTFIMNLLFGGKVTDSLVIFRAYKTSIIKELKIDTRSVAYGTQALVRAMKKKLKISEIPGDEPKRLGGLRKMNPIGNGLQELSMIMHEFFKWKF